MAERRDRSSPEQRASVTPGIRVGIAALPSLLYAGARLGDRGVQRVALLDEGGGGGTIVLADSYYFFGRLSRARPGLAAVRAKRISVSYVGTRIRRSRMARASQTPEQIGKVVGIGVEHILRSRNVYTIFCFWPGHASTVR